MQSYWLDISPFATHTFTVTSFHSNALALNSNYRYLVSCQTLATITANSLLLKPAKLVLDDAPIVIQGIIQSIKQTSSRNHYFNYEIELSAPTVALTKTSRTRIFLQQTIKEIASIVLAPFNPRWQLTRALKPRSMVVQYNETDWDFLLRILASEKINFTYLQQDNLELVLFDTLNSLPSASNNADSVWDMRGETRLVVQKNQLHYFASTDNKHVQPGMLFNQNYRVIAQKTVGYAPDAEGQYHDEEPLQFKNELVLIPAETEYTPAIIPFPSFYGTLVATTESVSSDVRAHLNENGHYRVRLPFDSNGAEAAQASPLLMLVQAHGGQNSGFHHPLLPGAQVMLGALDGDLENPVILGAWPSATHQPPVTSSNANDHIMRSTQGHTVQLTDHAETPFIKLESAESINQLHLQSDVASPFVALTTLGVLSLNAKKTLTQQTEQTANHSIGGSSTISVKQQQQTVVSGASKHHSGAHITTQTKQHLTRQTTEKNIIQQAQADIHTQAKQHQGYLSQKGNLNINSAKKTKFISHKDLNLGSDKELAIESNGHLLSMTASGDHLFSAKKFILNAPMINLNGSMAGLNPMGLSSGSNDASAFSSKATQIPLTGADMYVNHDVGTEEGNASPKAEKSANDKADTDEEFNLFVATVYGESVGQGPAAWKAIASVIMNRVNGPAEFKRNKDVTAVITHSHAFQAYQVKSPQFQSAYNYLEKKSTHEPRELEQLISAIEPIYDHQITPTTKAVYYYSPYQPKPPYLVQGLKDGTIKEINVSGVSGEDFIFYMHT